VNAVETTVAHDGNVLTRWIRGAQEFVQESYAELHKMTWPTMPELKRATIAIVILAVVLGLAIGWLDKLLSLLLVDGVAKLTR
jgi:preprotein translocase SecE subunit